MEYRIPFFFLFLLWVLERRQRYTRSCFFVLRLESPLSDGFVSLMRYDWSESGLRAIMS